MNRRTSACLISIPYSTIKRAENQRLNNKVLRFQFLIVRLKVARVWQASCILLFQFLIVRLKVNNRNATYGSTLFQFLIVRLKDLIDGFIKVTI